MYTINYKHNHNTIKKQNKKLTVTNETTKNTKLFLDHIGTLYIGE